MKILISVMIYLLLFPCLVMTAEFYRWTDENGVTHVSDQPPAEQGKDLKTYRLAKPPLPSVPESQPVEDTQSTATDDRNKAGAKDLKQTINCDQELAQARADYEEAKSHEIMYRRNYNDSYGYGRERKYWRAKLQEIEDKRQRLIELENICGAAGQESNLPGGPEE
ncbi:MAG: DUF4124 domain-containing protein [Syntrophaceae bacterium]|nr:DUF4124 domain-containing protein [Syntrophaceae bacterium]